MNIDSVEQERWIGLSALRLFLWLADPGRCPGLGLQRAFGARRAPGLLGWFCVESNRVSGGTGGFGAGHLKLIHEFID